MVAGSSTTTAAVPAPENPTALPLAGRVIVVDPGHNGANGQHPAEINRPVDAGGFMKPCNTTGTADSGLTEASYNWQEAMALRQDLIAKGATVVLTRPNNTGWGPCVDQRGLTAARTHADLLVSIHADGADTRTDHGFHVIAPTVGTDVSATAAGRSDILATDIRDALVKAGLSPSNYVGRDGLDRRGDLGTLNRATVPAAMLESGNMHNPSDLATMASANGRAVIAQAMSDAIVRFFSLPR
jgi:N-acetylmuramoyl-L-alanine amidase